MGSQFPHIIRRKGGPAPQWLGEVARLAPAAVADASKGEGIIASSIRPLTPDIHLCGIALTVRCGEDDNLMLHKAISMARHGDVLVVECEYSNGNLENTGCALMGGLMALVAARREVAGVVIDGAIRDSHVFTELRLPVYSRGVSLARPTKSALGYINHKVRVGGIDVEPGDLILGDGDGLVRVAAQNASNVARLAHQLQEQEDRWKEMIEGGLSTFEILRLDDVLETLGATEGRGQ